MTTSAAEFDPRAPAFAQDPYPFYAALRAAERVHYVESIDEWWVTRYADTRALLEDRRLGRRIPSEGSIPVPIAALGGQPLPPVLLRLDPPDHTRLRGLVNRAFTPGVVAGLRGRIETIAAGLLDAVEGAGRMDAVADFAVPLPVVVIAELLGVPAADRDQFKSWSTPLALALDRTQPAAVRMQAVGALQALAAYFVDLIAERERAPRADLVSELLAVEEQGDKLSRGELLSMCILILVAGHETTTNLIASGLLALLSNPDQLELVRRRRELVPNAVEEALRYQSPVQRARHSTKEPTEIAGTLVPGDAVVTAIIGSANRDPDAFPEPDRFDVERADLNHHLAFGRGPHFCLGAPLARLEGQIAFTAVLDRLPRLELEDPAPVWSPNTTVRSLSRLPVRF